MAFDPLSWGLGFGATRVTSRLLEFTYPNDLGARLKKAAKTWSDQLPDDLYTPAEPIFEINEDSDYESPGRAKLQAILYMHTTVPDVDVWYDALIETWSAKKKNLGSDANNFIKQDKNKIQKHLRDLAKSLHKECQLSPELFQVTALVRLASIADTGTSLKNEMAETRSILIDSLNKIESLQLACSGPSNIDDFLMTGGYLSSWERMSELNRIVLVDKPTTVVSGRLRQSQSWVGSPNCSILHADFVPPTGLELKLGLSRFLSKWSAKSTALESQDPSEIVYGIAAFHYDLLALHPFEDGNGSVARALSDSQARKYLKHEDRLGLLDQPDYISALREANNGSLDDLVKVVSEAL